MKVIVTGGRDYNDAKHFHNIMGFFKPTKIVQGGAPGADRLAKDWAKANGVDLVTYNADWHLHGKAAGPIRNRLMLNENKDAVLVAFPGGRGTANCVEEAEKLGIQTFIVDGVKASE